MSNAMKRIGARSLLALAVALWVSPMALAADGHAEGDGHDHGPAARPPARTEVKQKEHDPAAESAGEPKHDHASEKGQAAQGEGHEGEEGAHGDEVKLTPEAIKVFGIQTAKAAKLALAPSFAAPARVSYNTEAMAHVGSAVSGRVSELKVRLGDTVKKGDVLLVVDSPELGEAQSDYLIKRTNVASAEPVVETARSAYQRARELYEKTQGISLAEVQKRELELKMAEGAVLSAKAAVTAAENKLHLLGMSHERLATLVKTGEVDSRYHVLAPIDGKVIQREATLGELVSPEREALLVLADTSVLWVLADVPEARLASVGKGTKAKVIVAAAPHERIAGEVSYIAPEVDVATRSATVRIELHNGHLPIKPGMFAQVELSSADGNKGEAVLAIPEEAVQTVEGGPAVFVPVEGEANTYAKREVKIGPPVGGMVQVVEGLKEGDVLITRGSFILKAELGKGSAGHGH